MSDLLELLSDEQYAAVMTVINVVVSKMTIHHIDGDALPTALTIEQEERYAELKLSADFEVILQGATEFVERQFPAMDIDTGKAIIDTLR